MLNMSEGKGMMDSLRPTWTHSVLIYIQNKGFCSEIILCFLLLQCFLPTNPQAKGLAFFQPRPSPPKTFVPHHSSLSLSPTSNTTRKINKKPCFWQNIPCSPLNPPYLHHISTISPPILMKIGPLDLY